MMRGQLPPGSKGLHQVPGVGYVPFRQVLDTWEGTWRPHRVGVAAWLEPRERQGWHGMACGDQAQSLGPDNIPPLISGPRTASGMSEHHGHVCQK